MTQDLEPMISAALAAYSPSDAAIAKMREEYMPMRVAGEDDKAGHAAVRAARLIVKDHRVAVEKKRKELKEDALRYGQAVDAEARRLTAALAPIEDHLQAQEDIVAKAAERRRVAEEVAKAERLRLRMAALAEAEHYIAPDSVAVMTDEQFEHALGSARAALITRREAQRVEAERLAAERATLERQRAEEETKRAAERAEAERVRAEQDAKLASERAEIERQRAEAARIQAEAEAKIAAERAALEAERREQQRQADIKAAEDKARRDAEIERQRAEDDRRRREAMRPINEKLVVLSEHVGALEVPEFDRAADIRAILARAAREILAVIQ